MIDAGIEYFLPLFFDERVTIFDYFDPEQTVISLLGDNENALTRFMEETQGRYRFLKADPERPVLPPDTLYLNAEGFFTELKRFIRFQGKIEEASAPSRILVDRKAQKPLLNLERVIDEEKTRKNRVLIMAPSNGRRETMAQLFQRNDLKIPYSDTFESFLAHEEPVMLTVGPLLRGFTAENITILTETELYASAPKRILRRQSHSSNIDMMIRDIAELKIGDPVVHITHGIGRYAGLQTIDTVNGKEEFLRIDYAKDAKLFVPVAQLQLISRYSGSDAEHAPLHALGKNDWEKATSYFQKALTQDSGNDDLRIQTYLLSLILGNFTVADTLSESLNLNKESDWFVRQVHRADLFAARKYEAIVSSDFDPQNTADALLTAFFKSWTFAALGKEKEALNTLESIKKDQVLSPLYWYQKGLIHLYFKQETLADSAFQQLKVSGVPNASAWHAVRRFYETRGRWGKENPLYQDYMAFFTQKPALNQLLTELMPAQLDTPDKALSEAIYSVSTLVGEEDGFAALALNAAALRLNPDYDLIKILSAEILDNMGNYKQAAQYYNRIGKLSGLNFLKKGLSFQKAGMHDKALPVFQKLISENPKNALLYRLAAESFVVLEDGLGDIEL